MSNLDDSGRDTLLLLMIIGIFALVWHFDIAPISSETTVYIRVCDEKKRSHYCKNWKYLDPVTFTVNVDSNVVLRSTEGEPKIEKLSRCAVKDRNNWSCVDVDGDGDGEGYGEIFLSDGKIYLGAISIKDIDGLEQVSKLVHFKNTIFDYKKHYQASH